MDTSCTYLEKSKILFYVRLDLQGNYTYLSPYFCKYFGFKSENYLGKKSFSTICQEDHQPCLDILAKCKNKPNEAFSVKLRKLGKENKIVFTKWEFTLELDKNNQPYEYSCVGFDITKKVNRGNEIEELSLKQEASKLQYQALFETSTLAIVLHDLDGNLVLANNTFCDLVKINKEEFSKFKIFDFIKKENREANKKIIAELEKKATSVVFEFELIDINKNVIPVSINKLIFKDWTGKSLVWGVIKNITERKNHLSLLEQQKDLLEQTAQIANLGGWLIDLKTQKTEWTKEVYEIHDLEIGFDHNPVNGINFYHPDDRETISVAVNKAINDGERFDLELRFISAKNINKWLRIIGEPVYKDNKIVTVKGILQDITERKNKEETIITQNELLKEIYYSQSHLMRLPLANIIGLINLLEFETETSEIEIIKRKLKLSATQLDEVIKDLANKKALTNLP